LLHGNAPRRIAKRYLIVGGAQSVGIGNGQLLLARAELRVILLDADALLSQSVDEFTDVLVSAIHADCAESRDCHRRVRNRSRFR